VAQDAGTQKQLGGPARQCQSSGRGCGDDVTRWSVDGEGALQRAFQLQDFCGAIGTPTNCAVSWPVSPRRHARSLASMMAALGVACAATCTTPHLSPSAARRHTWRALSRAVKGASKSSIPQCGYPIAALKRRLLFQNSDQCVQCCLSLPCQALSHCLSIPAQHGQLPDSNTPIPHRSLLQIAPAASPRDSPSLFPL
jgi:hypothetical protein